MTHSLLPWRTEICGVCGSLTLHAAGKVWPEYDGDGNVDDDKILKPHFISIQVGGAVRNEEDAAFIVLAVNNHEALLEAARTADQWLADTGVIGVGHPVRKQLRAAIAAASDKIPHNPNG